MGALGVGMVMAARPASSVSAAARRRFEATRDAATLQLLFKAARLANEHALSRVAAGPAGPRVRPAHTTLFPHLDFHGIRLTELAARVGVTKQAVGQLVDDLVDLGVLERVDDPDDRRAKLIRFSRHGHAALMHGLGVLSEIQDALGAAVGARRMRGLHETLKRVIAALEGGQDRGNFTWTHDGASLNVHSDEAARSVRSTRRRAGGRPSIPRPRGDRPE
jgi:DNA-binding MarR family transcriptional regulator